LNFWERATMRCLVMLAWQVLAGDQSHRRPG
jgi:hypothetical protein